MFRLTSVVNLKRKRCIEILQHLENLILAEPWSREFTRRKITHATRGRDATTRRIRSITAAIEQCCHICYEDGVYFN